MSAPFPPVFSVQETSQRGQSLLQWRDGPGAAQLHSLQMSSDVAAFILDACSTHADLVEDLAHMHALFSRDWCSGDHLPRQAALTCARKTLDRIKTPRRYTQRFQAELKALQP